MGALPLALILAAASAHAAWNLVAKRSGGGVAFVWLCAVAGVIIWTPAALVQLVLDATRLRWSGLVFMAGSAALHAGYFNTLQRGYALGDLSLVYPLARGIAPLLAVLAALTILGEHANALTLAGAALIVVAVVSLSRGSRRQPPGPAIVLAAVTGALIAAYTVWDSHAVNALHQPVIVYYWGAEIIRVALLAGPALHPRSGLRGAWRTQRSAAAVVGLLSPAAYIFVLVALTLAPVVVVAPAREISIVFGVLVGATSLGEGHALSRTLAAAGIVAGIALLTIG